MASVQGIGERKRIAISNQVVRSSGSETYVNAQLGIVIGKRGPGGQPVYRQFRAIGNRPERRIRQHILV